MKYRITISGYWVNVEYGKLTSKDIIEIYEDYKKSDNRYDIPLLAGGVFQEMSGLAFWDINDFIKIEVTNLDTGEELEVDFERVALKKIGYMSDDEIMAGDITLTRYVSGEDCCTIDVETKDDEPFDPSKLTLQYKEFSLYTDLEKGEQVLCHATYDGQDCEPEWDACMYDEEFLYLSGYCDVEPAEKIDKSNEKTDLELVLLQNDAMHQDSDYSNSEYENLDGYHSFVNFEGGDFEWNWDGMDNYLKSKSENKSNFSPEDPIVLIKVSKNYKEDMTPTELYEVTRKSWIMSQSKLPKIKYAVAAAAGLTREVYSITKWYPVENRWAFIGEVAPEEIRKKYVNKQYEQKKGAANPISYFNID
jgi:hypothetical protein